MSWALVAEVLDLPVPLTPAERLVLVCLAERADARTRECWPGDDELCRRTGLSPRGLAAAFARLAARGIEVRVPLAPGRAGRGAYTAPGRRKTYRLPEWSHLSATESTVPERANGRTPVPETVAPECDPNHHLNRHARTREPRPPRLPLLAAKDRPLLASYRRLVNGDDWADLVTARRALVAAARERGHSASTIAGALRVSPSTIARDIRALRPP